MSEQELKEQLGDELCEFCPWRKGEIDHTFDSLCEGSYCDDAFDNFLDENEGRLVSVSSECTLDISHRITSDSIDRQGKKNRQGMAVDPGCDCCDSCGICDRNDHHG